jgi:hypothetical protein
MQLALSSNLTSLLLLSLILSLQLTFLNPRKKVHLSVAYMHADNGCPGYRIVSHYFVVIIGMLLGDAQSLLLLPSLVSFGWVLCPAP